MTFLFSNKAFGSLALAASITLSPLSAMAHTNAIGYSGDGSGDVTFWYGNWHSNTGLNGVFNEGEIKLEGVNGNTYTTTIVNFDEFVIYNPDGDNTPDGLVSGTNLFQSDGTQLVPVGDDGVNNPNIYTWQGATFTDLEPGDYRFTYIPVGDPESDNPNGFATMDWMPQDMIIRSSQFTLTEDIIGGDVGAPTPAPVVTNVSRTPAGSQSSTQVSYTPSVSGNEQSVTADYRTTTITNTQVTTTYSDGSEVITYESAVNVTQTGEVFAGRIDQIETLDEMTDNLYRTLNRTPSTVGGKDRIRFFSNGTLGWSNGENGYDGSSDVVGSGIEFDVTPNWVIGAQFNKINTNLNGVDSTSSKDSDHLGIFSMVHGNDLSLRTNGAIVTSDYEVNRSVGPFSNTGSTKGTQWWVNNRLYWHTNGQGIQNGVSPFVGHTIQNNTIKGYTEKGDSITARSVDSFNGTTNVGEVGVIASLRFGGKTNDFIGLNAEASYDTEQRVDARASVDFNEVVVIEGFHQISNNNTNSGVSANLQFKF